MLKSQPRTAIYADIEALPPNMVGEIVFGVLHAHPRPAPRHAVAANRIGYEVTGPFWEGHRRARWLDLHDRAGTALGPHVVVPDIAGWKRERLTPFPETAYIETPPHWLRDVLSPSTQALDRTDKLTVYAEYGVKHCWYVDPVARTLEALALAAGKWRIEATFKDEDAVAAPPFEVHTFGLDGLWVD